MGVKYGKGPMLRRTSVGLRLQQAAEDSRSHIFERSHAFAGEVTTFFFYIWSAIPTAEIICRHDMCMHRVLPAEPP